MSSNQEGRSVIDTLEDGDIYIEVGNDSTLITKVGGGKKTFQPYVDSLHNLTPVFYIYKISKDDLPTNFKSSREFIEAVNSQVEVNEYVENWVDIGAEEMSKQMSSILHRNMKDICHFGLNSGDDVFHRFFSKLTVYTEKRYDDILYAKESLNIDELAVTEKAPKDIKKHLNDIFSQLHREDRNYTFDDVNIDAELLSYVDGLVDVDYEKLKSHEGTTAVLVTDFYKNGEYISNALRILEDNQIEVLAVVCLAQQL
jgi:hypothetical protein